MHVCGYGDWEATNAVVTAVLYTSVSWCTFHSRLPVYSCSFLTSHLLICQSWDSNVLFVEGREISRHLLESMEAAQLMDLRYKMERLEESHICSICLENAWNVAFLCGHSACSKCAESLTLCHMCRKPIQSKINLFTWWSPAGKDSWSSFPLILLVLCYASLHQ